MGRLVHGAGSGVVAQAAGHRTAGSSDLARNLIWPALLRKLERVEPGWARY